jgi:hypothetical protein
MDRFGEMRVFTRVVERRSFTLTAQDLSLPRSTVTDAIKQLEARHVSPTKGLLRVDVQGTLARHGVR